MPGFALRPPKPLRDSVFSGGTLMVENASDTTVDLFMMSPSQWVEIASCFRVKCRKWRRLLRVDVRRLPTADWRDFMRGPPVRPWVTFSSSAPN